MKQAIRSIVVAVAMAAGLSGVWAADQAKAATPAKVYPTFGEVVRLDPAIDELIPPGAQIEKLAGGFEWAEGPVWDPNRNSLFFSDVPRNVIFEWKDGLGTRDYLYPSGYTGSVPRTGELGSNGLTLDREGRLVICQHGDRRIVRLEPDGRFTTLARLWKFRRFNSPNDLVYDSKGNLYFTDPSYGLELKEKDPARELVFHGVLLLRPNGEVVLLTDKLSWPNGVALSPDEKTLYVAVSDPNHPVIMAYEIKEDGTLGEGRVFFDATPLVNTGPGLPDGLKTDALGNVFATGPGGVLVLSPEGKHLGTIRTGVATANCAWGSDGSVLYMTADMYLCRIKTSTLGREFDRDGSWARKHRERAAGRKWVLVPAASTMETLAPSRLIPAGREAPSRSGGPGRWMARRLGLMLLLMPAVLASPPTGPEIRVFFGLCDASAVVPAGQGAFWVGNDEENTLRLYDPAAGPRALEVLPLDDFLEVDREHPEADIEGAADAGELVFWITSHGRNKDGKNRPSRRRFFATRWVEAPGGRGPRRLVPAGKPFKGLLEVLLEDPRYGGFGLREGSRRAPKEAGGLNIEGLAVAPGGALWIGFRNPIPRGRALIATLLNPREVTLTGARPRLGEPILLDLGGLGIRDLARDGDQWWILAGEPDGGGEFGLFRWKGPGARPVPEALPIPADFSPEAIAAMGEGRLLLLSDDGTREIDGCRCKDLKEPGQRRFRALWWKPLD